MTPYKSKDDKHYGRLLAPAPAPTAIEWFRLAKGLFDLTEKMADNGSRPPGNDVGIEVGYTYFGQFIDHDLTNDETSLGDVLSLQSVVRILLEPEEIRNRQTPHLDLSHLYGRGPEHSSSQHLYEPGNARFLVGKPVWSTVLRRDASYRSIDVAVGRNGRPLTEDRRASENIILRQITAVFKRLHNVAVEQCRDHTNGIAERFECARLQTARQFQWLVVKDYLATILHPKVYARVFEDEDPLFKWQPPQKFCIPIEFSVAAMRFGHSMVRDAYTLSDETDADLIDLIKPGSNGGPLDPMNEVDWARFFQGAGPGALATTAQPIDTLISQGMFQIPLGTLRLFNSGTVPPFDGITQFDKKGLVVLRLPFITLLRGVAMKLPTGQTVADAFKVDRLDEKQLTFGTNGEPSPQGQILVDSGLTTNTPLWYYLLRESEVRENGRCLGEVASNIVAETIFAALQDDPTSYVHLDPSTMPPTWKWGTEERQFRSLSALFEAAPDLP